VPESLRISNESAKIGAFMMAMMLMLAGVQNTKMYRKHEERQREQEAKNRLHSRQRVELNEKQQIDHLLKNSMREALVREQQKRQLVDRHT